jgi:hypothetical protein
MIPLFLTILGCASNAEITVFPTSLDWGDVDFLSWPGDMEEPGYAPIEVTITNTSEVELTPSVTGIDLEHLCVAGFEGSVIDLPSLSPMSVYVLNIAVCAYSAEAGERDTVISGELSLGGQGVEPVSLPWSFTPVLGIAGVDTGL